MSKEIDEFILDSDEKYEGSQSMADIAVANEAINETDGMKMTMMNEDVEYVEFEENKKTLKFAYTEDEILNLSTSELMELLSIKTADNIIVYFDLVSTIEIDQVILVNAENIPIATYEKYVELTEKFARYKMFKLMHDGDGTISTLQKAEQRLEERIDGRMELLENQFNENTDRLMNKIETEIIGIRESVLQQVEPAVNNLISIANNTSKTLTTSLTEVDRKVKRLNHQDLDKVINKLEKVTTLLADVVE